MRKTHGSKTMFYGFITSVTVTIQLEKNPLQGGERKCYLDTITT